MAFDSLAGTAAAGRTEGCALLAVGRRLGEGGRRREGEREGDGGRDWGGRDGGWEGGTEGKAGTEGGTE